MDKSSLYRFFSNQASVEEEKQILDWLDENPGHRKVLLKERLIFDAAIVLTANEKSVATEHVKKKMIPFWLWEIGKIAAVALLIVGIGYIYLDMKRTELLSSIHTLAVPAGQRIDYTLPDGSQIAMNAQSELSFPSFFGKERRVKLQGEAYFDITHDAKRPFIIETDKYDIEILGTTFNLNTGNLSGQFSVALLEGKVKVINRENRKEQITLLHDQYACIWEGKLTIGPIEDYDALRWRDGLFCFRNKSFTELIPDIEKYYDVQVIVNWQEIPENAVSGKIRVSDGVEHALRVLQKTIHFEYKKDERMIYIE